MDSNPLESAFENAKVEKEYRNRLSPWRRRRLRNKVEKRCQKLLKIWRKQRKYDEDSKRFEKLEVRALNLIDEISPMLDRLGYYSADWVLQLKERFETEL